jgi:hypothetical protein
MDHKHNGEQDCAYHVTWWRVDVSFISPWLSQQPRTISSEENTVMLISVASHDKTYKLRNTDTLQQLIEHRVYKTQKGTLYTA